MEAIFRLAWLREDSSIVPVNWRDMETEELGSVYEGLLELTPRLTQDGRGFAFAEGLETKGNERKKTGSYYTPDNLVQALLDSALDPVLDRVESEAQDAPAALLGVTVMIPLADPDIFSWPPPAASPPASPACEPVVLPLQPIIAMLARCRTLLRSRRRPQPHGHRARARLYGLKPSSRQAPRLPRCQPPRRRLAARHFRS